MNSLKSLCSRAKASPVLLYKFQKDIESLLRGEVGVELIVGRVGVFEAFGYPSDAFHGENCITQ